MAKQKLGLATMAKSGVDPIEQIKMMKNVGFEAFFTGWIPERTEEIANEAARLGMYQQSIHSPFSKEYKVSHLWNGGEEGEFVTKSLIACVEDCGRFDIPVMVIHPFIGFKDHTPTQVGLDNYARVIDAANKAGVKLGFENVEGEEYLAAIMERFWNEPSLGFCLDTGHEMCYNYSRDMITKYGQNGKLIATHINDNMGITKEKIFWHDDAHLVPFDGVADWKGVADRLNAVGYNGILTSELTINNKPDRDCNSIYHKLSHNEYLALVYERLSKIAEMMQK